MVVQLADCASDGHEFVADAGDWPGDDALGAGESFTRDGANLGEAGGDR
ncbi:hypothetical protein E0500_001600 [Streptomyces sp. KM273126]|nr:hypothetical protein [Streptomyces sp. KM273126]MBA2806188.1 hypothetical protein [Streptomyces sp. KM273126]